MPARNASGGTYARATYVLRPKDIADVVCHRNVGDVEEYLVQWASTATGLKDDNRAYSWHTLPELWKCLHMVQTYLEKRPRANPSQLPPLPADRKRKSPDQDTSSRDIRAPHLFTRNGLLTPDGRSRSPSIAGSSNTKTSDDTTAGEPRFYGVSLQKKEGYLVPHKPKNKNTPPLKRLPTEWRDTAAYTPVDQADQYIRAKFMDMLRPVGNCHLQNDVDNSTPSLDFTFVDRYVFRNGIIEQPLEFVEGCQYPCRPNMGGHCGCEYTKLCKCLEFGAVDDVALEAKDSDLFQRYKEAEKSKEPFDTIALPKRFPYSRKAKDAGSSPQTLVHKYLNSRNPIYECNPNCNCGPVCKSRLVQKGRKVPLTIFKTPDRGWGVYCNEDLVTGEFVDTYLGEVIDFEEAEQREQEVGEIKNSYMYTLDKFVGDIDGTGKEIEAQDCHVVDGQYMGTPSRFINHSCEPNLRQYTVHYNKNDLYVYQLAFFAVEDISAGTELTFDYMDKDELELEDAIRAREKAFEDKANIGKARCNCGTKKCRGFLF